MNKSAEYLVNELTDCLVYIIMENAHNKSVELKVKSSNCLFSTNNNHNVFDCV